ALFTPHVLEASELFQERQLGNTRRAVALLGDDDLRDARVFFRAVVLLFAVDECDYVGVLFQGPRIMRNDRISQPRFWSRNCQIIDFLLSRRLNGDDAIPEDVVGRSGCKFVVTKYQTIFGDKSARRSKAEVR